MGGGGHEAAFYWFLPVPPAEGTRPVPSNRRRCSENKTLPAGGALLPTAPSGCDGLEKITIRTYNKFCAATQKTAESSHSLNYRSERPAARNFLPLKEGRHNACYFLDYRKKFYFQLIKGTRPASCGEKGRSGLTSMIVHCSTTMASYVGATAFSSPSLLSWKMKTLSTNFGVVSTENKGDNPSLST